MDKIRDFRKSTKGFSPVIATVILVAVAVVVTLASTAWIGGLASDFEATEQLKITSAQFVTGNNQIQLIVTNVGTSTVTIKQITINGALPSQITYAYGNGTTLTGTTIPANGQGLVITLTSGWSYSCNYLFKVVTSKGNSFQYTASPT
jgi:archaeal type IV pilus assembly protein PilA